MNEALKIWFQTRLGITVDLNPEVFGRNARDGTLMAKILRSYDIINDSQLNTIISTQDPFISRVNLQHLKKWTRFIQVDFDDQSINDISNGEGYTTILIFYKIFLALEKKDLRTEQKFPRNPTKFEVTKVSEELSSELLESPLAAPLVENSETVKWIYEKCQDLIKTCKQDRERFKKSQKYKNKIFGESVSKSKVAEMKQSEMRDIKNFERKQKSLYEINGEGGKKKNWSNLKTRQAMMSAVEGYLKKTKKQRVQDETVKQFKGRMQKLLLSEIWEKMLEDQENKFDEILAEKVLTQSEYEKRIMENLLEIRLQKDKITKNRQIADDLEQKAKEDEILLKEKQELERKRREEEELNNELNKILKLQRSIYEEKVRIRREKIESVCLDIVKDLADISIKSAECLREEGFIPISLWNEWKTLFVTNQPIFQLDADLESEGDGVEEGGEAEEKMQSELKRQEILNTADFEAYHNIESPWDKYLPELDNKTEEILRLGGIVLGYIVHKLLKFLYSQPSEHELPPVPEVDKKVIILGLPEQVFSNFKQLLVKSEIKLIFMEDAIHHCFTAFKEETKNDEYISLSPLILKKRPDKKEKSDKKSIKQSRSKKYLKTKENIDSNVSDKQAQTTRDMSQENIDLILSDDARIGKWTYDILTSGQALPVELNTRILIQYLKSLKNIKGWVLVNYPSDYEQMTSLEKALSGCKSPLVSDKDDVFSIQSKVESSDSFSIYRYSKLVPNPIIRTHEDPKTFMTNFIRVVVKSKDLGKNIFEILSDDVSPIDVFYANQGIANAFYYFDFDAPTLKKLARLVVGDKCLPRKSSSELFGEAEKTMNRNVLPSIVKQLISKSSVATQSQDSKEEKEEIPPENLDLQSITKPGEESWEWIDFPQSGSLLESISILWENLEASYVANLKDIFFIKRIHTNAILPFKNFVLKHMEEIISRPDIKQEIFEPFYLEFNSIDEAMRMDSEMKCELQCRVSDIQTELLDICDKRKIESESERQRMVGDDWTATEAITFINIYIDIIQVEVDRCTDTVQILQDYYNSMLQKPLGKRVSKVQLLRLETSADLTTQKSKQSVSVESTRKKKSNTDFTLDPPAPVSFDVIKDEITDSLLNEKTDPRFGENDSFSDSISYKAVKANIEYVNSVVESLASSFNGTLKKTAKKGKSKKSRKTSELDGNSGQDQNLKQEWYYALFFEINRIKLRLKILDEAFLFDIGYLLGITQKVFHQFRENLVDRYRKEINSVNEMTDEFWLAIEEERSVKDEMFFEGARFLIKKANFKEVAIISEENSESEMTTLQYE